MTLTKQEATPKSFDNAILESSITAQKAAAFQWLADATEPVEQEALSARIAEVEELAKRYNDLHHTLSRARHLLFPDGSTHIVISWEHEKKK